jgi:hypothetical protein
VSTAQEVQGACDKEHPYNDARHHTLCRGCSITRLMSGGLYDADSPVYEHPVDVIRERSESRDEADWIDRNTASQSCADHLGTMPANSCLHATEEHGERIAAHGRDMCGQPAPSHRLGFDVSGYCGSVVRAAPGCASSRTDPKSCAATRRVALIGSLAWRLHDRAGAAGVTEPSRKTMPAE